MRVFYHFNAAHQKIEEGSGACPLCDLKDPGDLRKHFYDKHCAVVGDDAERKELESLRQMRREEAEKLKQEKREGAEKLKQEKKAERQSKKETMERLKREKRRRESKRIIEKVPPKKKSPIKKGPSPKDLVPKKIRVAAKNDDGGDIDWDSIVGKAKWRPIPGRIRNPCVCRDPIQ